MRHILHILTDANRDTAAAVIEAQKADKDVELELLDLAAATPNYDALLEKIFSADSVQVW
jgi:hypothetical protein